MTAQKPVHNCQLMVIGAGMAGMAAALFAARKGLTTVQAGLTGETLYASGLFDLYGVAHGDARQLIDDPWQGLEALKQRHPEHPFCKVTPDQIRCGMAQFADFLDRAGQPYTGYPDKNARLITSVGTIKRTFRVPATMWEGVKALEEKRPCLIVDIAGLRGFSAVQLVATLKGSWPELTAATVAIPSEDRLGPKYAEHIARGLHIESARRELAEAIRPHLGRARTVGLPAVLGVQTTDHIHRDLQRMLGV
ncbi:MAG TPA: FAD-binding protein, partial [Desulfosarcina sp.]|nr:FAD-binding protein [Desulfosarcina sp.]